MYCSRCGQQFMSDVRFCSRCGMPLNAIAEITANHGFTLPSDNRLALKNRAPRQKGMRIGAMIMLGSLALSPLFFGMCFIVRAGGPLLIPLTGFLIGLAWLLHSYIFAEDRTPSRKQYESDHRLPNTSGSSFASPREIPLSRLNARRTDLPESIEPPSVTDHTTQFFD
jgi:hypothetical protein